MNTSNRFTYQINPRNVSVGGGYQLKLMDGDVEVGGGVYPATPPLTSDDAYSEAFEAGEEWLQSRSVQPCDAGTNAILQLDDTMIDIETLGTKPGAAILSVGAVMFGSAGLGEEFYSPVLLQSCTDVGLTIDPDTVAWWMKQSDEARQAAFRADAPALPAVLQSLTDWFTAQKARYPWCHGATFDVPILDAAYAACGLQPPWKFYDVRDTRTLYDLAVLKVDRSKGVHHNALDDARVQAEVASRAFRDLRARVKRGELPPEIKAALEEDAATRATSALLPDGSAIFINYGDQPEDTAALHCTACNGSGHTEDQTRAARDVLGERRRQVEQEGYDEEHDDVQVGGETGAYAAFYAMPPAARSWPASETGCGETFGGAIVPADWTVPEEGDRRRELVKAGALILAEIERIDRSAMSGALGTEKAEGNSVIIHENSLS